MVDEEITALARRDDPRQAGDGREDDADAQRMLFNDRMDVVVALVFMAVVVMVLVASISSGR